MSSRSIYVVIRLHGAKHDFLLYVGVDGGSNPLPGFYGLPDLKSPVTSNNIDPEVAVREYSTGAFWQATASSLAVYDSSPSGFVVADLKYQGGAPSPPPSDLKIVGNWACK
ncbi:MAG: hypothetical protein ACRDNK_02615 [Solirubrobacteraceae bacterium]